MTQPGTSTAGPTMRDYLQFAALPIIWGSSFLFIKVSLEGLSPIQVAWGRAVLGGTTLLLIVLATRQRWPRNRSLWLEMVPVSMLLTVMPFFLISWGGQFISSGLMSIFNATTPLWTMLIAIAALPQERPTGRKYAGLALGFVGVVVLLNPWSMEGTDGLLGQVASLGAAACYGAGYVTLRRVIAKHEISPITLAAMQVGIGGTLFVLATPWIAATRTPDLSGRVVLCMLLLGCLGTGVAYILNNNVVRSMGATTASMVTYVNPVVGVTLGVIVLSEAVHWNEPIGALLVIGGILLGQQGATPKPRVRPAGRAQAETDGRHHSAP